MKKRERAYFHSMGCLCKPANMMKLFLKNKKKIDFFIPEDKNNYFYLI